jgi:hypothetical protein
MIVHARTETLLDCRSNRSLFLGRKGMIHKPIERTAYQAEAGADNSSGDDEPGRRVEPGHACEVDEDQCRDYAQ